MVSGAVEACERLGLGRSYTWHHGNATCFCLSHPQLVMDGCIVHVDDLMLRQVLGGLADIVSSLAVRAGSPHVFASTPFRVRYWSNARDNNLN